MKTVRASLAALAILAAAGMRRNAQQPTPSTPSPPAPYMMTMGDLMNTLVQPRHAKLGLAGQARNWPLAGYALVEIRQAFAGIVKAQPTFRGLPVAELVDAALKEPLDAVDAAIRQQDPQEIRRRLRSAHPRLQRLPRGGRSSFRGHQSARRVGVSEPEFRQALRGLVLARKRPVDEDADADAGQGRGNADGDSLRHCPRHVALGDPRPPEAEQDQQSRGDRN